MISSDDHLGDRPARRHFTGIVFSAVGLMLLAILLAIIFLHFNKSAAAPPGKQANPSVQQ